LDGSVVLAIAILVLFVFVARGSVVSRWRPWMCCDHGKDFSVVICVCLAVLFCCALESSKS
jgi:hypothetical protein